MNQKEFFVRSYPKSELAMLYFPDATPPTVVLNRLNAWIRCCEELGEGHVCVFFRFFYSCRCRYLEYF